MTEQTSRPAGGNTDADRRQHPVMYLHFLGHRKIYTSDGHNIVIIIIIMFYYPRVAMLARSLRQRRVLSVRLSVTAGIVRKRCILDAKLL